MSTASEFGVFIAGSLLSFSIFVDMCAAKDGLFSFMVLLLAPYMFYGYSLPSLGSEQTRNSQVDQDAVSNLNKHYLQVDY